MIDTRQIIHKNCVAKYICIYSNKDVAKDNI